MFVDGNTSVGPGIDASSVGGMQRRGQRDRAPISLVFIDDPSAGFTDPAGTCHLNRRNFRLLPKIPGAFGRRKRRDVISALVEAMADAWGCSLSAKRDQLAGPDVSAQRRGIITRQLREELRKTLDDGND